MRLISYENTPPGSYPYNQTGDKPRSFKATPTIESQALAVAAYRRANGLPRATYPEALQDIDEHQCSRLGNNPRWCVESGASPQYALASNAPGLVPCKSCGAPVT